MADAAMTETQRRPIVRMALEYVLACFFAFGAFIVLQNVMMRISNTLLGDPISHHAEMLYLSIAAVSVAFADPVGALQQRDGWKGHVIGAVMTLTIGFAAALAYVALSRG